MKIENMKRRRNLIVILLSVLIIMLAMPVASANGDTYDHTVCKCCHAETLNIYVTGEKICSNCCYRYEVDAGVVKETFCSNWSGWTKLNDTQHQRTCQGTDCHNVQTENHSGGTPTCTEQATCDFCNAKYGNTLDHDWSNPWTKKDDDSHHKLCSYGCKTELTENHTGGTATCLKKAACTVCGEEYGNTNPNNHEGEIIIDKKDNSTHSLVCECGATIGEEAHSFEYHSTADEKHSVNCTKRCGLEILESHTWTAKSDANYHWEECICKDIRNKAAHTPGDAVKEKEVAAKVGEAGSYDEVVYCTVCKAEISRKTVKTDPLPEPVKEYTVTYKNIDGTVLQSDKWKAGQIPLYTGMEPTEKENVYYKSFFIGWNPDVTAVTGDAEYTAVYKQDYKYYEVTFVRSEFSGAGQSCSYEKVRAGRPVNRPANPSDVEKSESMHVTTTFSFSHWTLAENEDISIPYDFFFFFTHNITLSAVYKDDYERLYSMEDLSKTHGIGCFIATCVYGSYDCPEVWVLRRFRDNVLAKSEPGRLFIELYYRWSPEIVEKYGDEPWFKPLVKPVLDKFVAYLKIIGFEDTPYEDPEYGSDLEALEALQAP